MGFQDDQQTIRWRLHLNSPPGAVYAAIATERGRLAFWAESAPEKDGLIHFQFPNQATWAARVLAAEPPRRFSLEYYGGSVATFTLTADGRGGTDVELTDTGVAPAFRTEVIAGWVSVLLTLKAAVDFGVDLRNHDPQRQWDTGYADN